MPMADAMELMDYWEESPPVHLLLKMQMRFAPSDDRPAAREKAIADRPSAPKLQGASPRDREIFEALRAHA